MNNLIQHLREGYFHKLSYIKFPTIYVFTRVCINLQILSHTFKNWQEEVYKLDFKPAYLNEQNIEVHKKIFQLYELRFNKQDAQILSTITETIINELNLLDFSKEGLDNQILNLTDVVISFYQLYQNDIETYKIEQQNIQNIFKLKYLFLTQINPSLLYKSLRKFYLLEKQTIHLSLCVGINIDQDLSVKLQNFDQVFIQYQSFITQRYLIGLLQNEQHIHQLLLFYTLEKHQAISTFFFFILKQCKNEDFEKFNQLLKDITSLNISAKDLQWICSRIIEVSQIFLATITNQQFEQIINESMQVLGFNTNIQNSEHTENDNNTQLQQLLQKYKNDPGPILTFFTDLFDAETQLSCSQLNKIMADQVKMQREFQKIQAENLEQLVTNIQQTFQSIKNNTIYTPEIEKIIHSQLDPTNDISETVSDSASGFLQTNTEEQFGYKEVFAPLLQQIKYIKDLFINLLPLNYFHNEQQRDMLISYTSNQQESRAREYEDAMKNLIQIYQQLNKKKQYLQMCKK